MDNRAPNDLIELPGLIRDLYRIVDRLEELYPGRKFTPDGHLVGSIGEVVARYVYGLDLLASSEKAHDATAQDGRSVQVKMTGGKGAIGISYACDHLVVIRLVDRREFQELYNGPGQLLWAALPSPEEGRQNFVHQSILRDLQKRVPPESQLPMIRGFPTLEA